MNFPYREQPASGSRIWLTTTPGSEARLPTDRKGDCQTRNATGIVQGPRCGHDGYRSEDGYTIYKLRMVQADLSGQGGAGELKVYLCRYVHFLGRTTYSSRSWGVQGFSRRRPQSLTRRSWACSGRHRSRMRRHAHGGHQDPITSPEPFHGRSSRRTEIP
jgi:hypothetical protein